jgi:hypothetical protein
MFPKMLQMFRHTLRGVLPVALLLAFSFLTAAQAQKSLEEWENVDFSKRSIRLAEIEKLSEENLKLMRGLIFGRHGRVFKDALIRNYLEGRAWFKANPNFQNSLLNSTERANLDVIREAEAKKHAHIEPGDLRFYQKRLITTKQLGEHTGAEWQVLRAEVEAIHGKRFDEPWLQRYFEERYWYQPADQYDPKKLSQIERQNLQTMAAAQKKQRKLAISPGDMEHFQDATLTEKMLEGLSLHELRLLRNEAYARRGRQFSAIWLQQYFFSQPWYEPLDDQTTIELSPTEKKNVENIVATENKLREDLRTKPINASLLEGLFIEDALKLRNEIYARHGKVFKEKWFQEYFESFDWYKADPQFNLSTLSAVEKKNAATLQAYERKATSVFNVIEG